MEISEDVKQVARHALHVIGGKPSVQMYVERDLKLEMDIATYVDDRYDDDIISYSTLGLCNYTLGLVSDDKPIRVELVGAAQSQFEDMPKILAACAYGIMDGKYTAMPGGIYPSILDPYCPDSDMRHVLLNDPYFWTGFDTLEFPDKHVVWLMLVPISDDEFYYAGMNGSDALMEQLELHDIDPTDLNRKTILKDWEFED